VNPKDLIRNSLDMSDRILNSYLGDLSDDDLFLRPVAGMNHIAWQFGHLISAERMFVETVKPGSSPPLPEGFDEAHNKEATKSDDRSNFRSKDEYFRLMQAQRAATRATLDAMSDADLDAPSPERFQKMCPKVGNIFLLAGQHVIMHAGQWVAVRRQVGKPVVI
jgi:uncharacterized damage-inducible protein DinB